MRLLIIFSFLFITSPAIGAIPVEAIGAVSAETDQKGSPYLDMYILILEELPEELSLDDLSIYARHIESEWERHISPRCVEWTNPEDCL